MKRPNGYISTAGLRMIRSEGLINISELARRCELPVQRVYNYLGKRSRMEFGRRYSPVARMVLKNHILGIRKLIDPGGVVTTDMLKVLHADGLMNMAEFGRLCGIRDGGIFYFFDKNYPAEFAVRYSQCGRMVLRKHVAFLEELVD